MSILKKIIKHRYTTIPNEVLIDKDISASEFRVYCYLFSKPNNWEVNNSDIKKQLQIKSDDSIAKYLGNLVNVGWLYREKEKTENGRFTGRFNYILFDVKNLNFPNPEKIRIRKKSESGKNTKYINTNLNTNTNTNTNPEERKDEYKYSSYASNGSIKDSSLKYPPERLQEKSKENKEVENRNNLPVKEVEPTESPPQNDPRCDKVIEFWNTLDKVVKHSKDPRSKVYKKSKLLILRLMEGIPVSYRKNGELTQHLIDFFIKQRVDEKIACHKFSLKEIKEILQQMNNNYLQDKRKYQLPNVIWNRFSKGGSFSWFYFVATNSRIPEEFIKLGDKLADIVITSGRLPEGKIMDWGKTIQDFSQQYGISSYDIGEVLGWYSIHHKEPYIPEVYSAEEFIDKYENIVRAIDRTERKKHLDEKKHNYQKDPTFL